MADAPDAIYGLPLSPGERLVLVLLWRHAPAGEENPVVWPSAARLAAVTGFGDRAVRRMLIKLAAMGAITRCTRPSAAMSAGKAWRLDPIGGQSTRVERPGSVDPGGQVARAEQPCSPGPSDPGGEGRAARLGGAERPPRSIIEAPEESPFESENAQDPRLALADAINAQAEHVEAVRRANPPARMNPGSAITPEHRALLDRYDAVIGSWPPGSPERDRAAACRPALPVPHVIESAIRAAGGMVRIVAVHEWAWRSYAAGRLTKIGSVDASQALVSAFLGAGRFWQSILAAYNQAHPRHQSLAEWQPTPDPEGPPIDPETYDNLLQAIGR